MVGIFKGSTPVNPSKGSSSLKEVYVGAVKVWPTTPPKPWIEYIGVQAIAVSGASAGILYRSNANITAADITGNEVSVGFATSSGTSFALGNSRSTLSTYVVTGMTARLFPPNWRIEAFRATATQANDPMFLKVGTPLAEGDFIDEAVMRWGSTGLLQSASDPGLTVSRISAGRYNVVLPPGKMLAATTSIIMTCVGTGNVIPDVTSVNLGRTEFVVEIRNVTNVAVDTATSVYIAMVNQ